MTEKKFKSAANIRVVPEFAKPQELMNVTEEEYKMGNGMVEVAVGLVSGIEDAFYKAVEKVSEMRPEQVTHMSLPIRVQENIASYLNVQFPGRLIKLPHGNYEVVLTEYGYRLRIQKFSRTKMPRMSKSAIRSQSDARSMKSLFPDYPVLKIGYLGYTTSSTYSFDELFFVEPINGKDYEFRIDLTSLSGCGRQMFTLVPTQSDVEGEPAVNVKAKKDKVEVKRE